MAEAVPGTRLVIVESPAKARTIAGYLGTGFVVESSIGHIRDLPNNAAEVPAKYRGLPWARLGVDVDNQFQPVYVVPADKKSHIAKLRKLLAGADELLLATDEDREGEAIAWHLFDELKPRVPVRRMVFHEITPAAIRAAVESPRDIDQDLVDAQETRRILDRLYGYEVSPVLWKKVMSRLSAGRVQSVATRLVVDRERERIAHRSATYWDLQAIMQTSGQPAAEGARSADPRQFPARLVAIDGTRVATGRDFNPAGQLVDGREVVHLDEPRTGALAEALRDRTFTVRSVESKPYTRRPYPPFRTTTLQQEASRKLGFGASVTMQLAQRLYENGFITYMRTDSVTLSAAAVASARDQVRELYGADYVPDQPRTYTSKVKNAQEAHEAIRPSGERFRTPGETGLTGDQYRVYELIWMRTVASQMRDAQGRSVQVRLGSTTADGTDAVLAASGRVISFHGFLRAYVEDLDDPGGERDDRETRLPDLSEGEQVEVARLDVEGHETRPPARFTEATLVRELEEREIGRPSTYASILRTILDRGYVYKKGTALVPSWVAFSVTRLLEQHFARLVDYDFTARLEDVLDEVAGGRENAQRVLGRFWFGGADKGDGGGTGLKALVSELGDIDARELATFPVRDEDGADTGVVLRVGRYGPYVEDSDGARGNVPDDLPPDELTADVARELLANPAGAERELGADPTTGNVVVAKNGRYGPYVTEQLPDDAPRGAKARTGSLFKDMDLTTVTLDDALRLLSLPRTVGQDPESGEPITAQNGRYGPYLKKGTDSRSLESEQQLFTITRDEALQLYAQPKQHGRQAARAPLRELGEDPGSGTLVTVKEGRFGPYVTDGETNATLRKGDDPASVTIERAAELLADKRAKGPTPRKRPAKRATKKAAGTKTTRTAKSTAKSTAKKTTKKTASKAASTTATTTAAAKRAAASTSTR